MREIFKGKRIDNDEWVYGYLIEGFKGQTFIVGEVVDFNEYYFNTEFWWRVYPETVGQFIGWTDYTYTRIFKGDKVCINNDLDNPYVVDWNNDELKWVLVANGVVNDLGSYCHECQLYIIGNIHEREQHENK